MVDSLTKDQRHRVMASIHGKDTKPEMAVRRLLYASGYRYRLHARDLPGTPDIVFRGRRKAIFVNGCFWHVHSCKNGQHAPATNPEFWADKRARTVERDARTQAELVRAGWGVLVIWECELKPPDGVGQLLREFLGPPPVPRVAVSSSTAAWAAEGLSSDALSTVRAAVEQPNSSSAEGGLTK